MYEFMDIFCASEIGGTEDDAMLSYKDSAFKPSINVIEKCCAVCSHLDTLACSSCVSYKVHLGEILTSRSAVDVGCFKALVYSNG